MIVVVGGMGLVMPAVLVMPPVLVMIVITCAVGVVMCGLRIMSRFMPVTAGVVSGGHCLAHHRIGFGRTRLGAAAAAFVAAFFLVGFAIGTGVFGQQRFAVGDRNLVIVGMDFAESQKAVAVAAIFDEGRLKRRLHPGHFGQIDIASQLFSVSGFEVEFLDPVSANHHNPCFFRVGGIDQHFVRHEILSLAPTLRVQTRDVPKEPR